MSFSTTRARLFTGGLATALALAVALAFSPGVPGAEATVAEEESFSVEINWPAGEIQNGQYCQGYIHMYGSYTLPLSITWSQQFDNSDAFYGGYGANSIVGANTSNSRPASLRVDVTDSSTPPQTAHHTVYWTWGAYNGDCPI